MATKDFIDEAARTTRVEVEGTHDVQHHSFGSVDQKGRVIGAFVSTREVAFAEQDGGHSFWMVRAGHYFALTVHATRNGNAYGALQGEQLFASAADRTVAIAKYLKSAARRAAKAAQ